MQSVLAAFFLFTGGFACPLTSLAESRALFDGKSLNGWSVQNHGQFSAKGGVITLDRGLGWLRSDEIFADFALLLEFRFLEKGANSGIFVRTAASSQANDKGYPDNGYQIQCMDTFTGSQPLGSLILYGAPPIEDHIDRDAIQRAYRPTLAWNLFEITCRGETLSVKLNGIEVTTATGIKNLRGHIGIQGEMGLLEFRRIEITSLPAQ